MNNFLKSCSIFCILVCSIIAAPTPLQDKKVISNCTDRNQTWWKSTVIYEVFLRSFKDSDGDGYGDLKGVIEKLDHFVDLNVETLWLSPFYESPMVDMGYDISDYYKVDSSFGTMDDFKNLLFEMKKRGMKLLMDFVINHTSDEHPWFSKSIQREEPYTNYYIWVDAKGYDDKGEPILPNNWLSLFGGPTWTWNPTRKQFYYHYFSRQQPDLNLRSPQVVQEIKNIFDFWLEQGVDGVRLDAPVNFFEDEQLRDSPPKHPGVPMVLNKDQEKENYTCYHPDTYIFMHEMREYIENKYNNGTGVQKIMTLEADDINEIALRGYGNSTYPIGNFPYIYDLELDQGDEFPNADKLNNIIQWWFDHIPEGKVFNWASENHDRVRIADRMNIEYGEVILALTMLLPGSVTVYYGQEIGMSGTGLREDLKRDLYHPSHQPIRDPTRLPMQWDTSPQAGFTTNHNPWLPINPNYWYVNVEMQKLQKRSRYHLFKDLTMLRQTETMKSGSYKPLVLSNWVFAFRRHLDGYDCNWIVINLGAEIENVALTILPARLTIVTASTNIEYEKGTVFENENTKVVMRPYSFIVFKVEI